MDINIATFLYIFLHICPLILVCFFTISSVFNNDIKGIVYLCGLLVSITIIIMFNMPINYFLDLIKQFGFMNQDHASDAICSILSFGNNNFTSLSIGQLIIGFTFVYLLQFMLLNDGWNTVEANWPTMVFFGLIIFFEMTTNTNINKTAFLVLSAMIGLFVCIGIYTTPILTFIGSYWPFIITLIGIILGILIQYLSIKDLQNKIIQLLTPNTANDPSVDPSPYCYEWITSIITYTIGGGFGLLYARIIDSFKTPELKYFEKYKNNEKCERSTNKNTFTCKVYKNGKHDPDAVSESLPDS